MGQRRPGCDGLIATQLAAGTGDGAPVYLLARDSKTSRLLRVWDGGERIESLGAQTFSAIAVNPADSSLHAGGAVPSDAYVAAFDPQGTLIYSTFLGGAAAERGDGIAVDGGGHIYIAGFRSTADFMFTGTTFVARADGSGYPVDLGPSTSATVLDMPSRGITIAPDGSIVAVMIATRDGLPVENSVQSKLRGTSDVYVIKWKPARD